MKVRMNLAAINHTVSVITAVNVVVSDHVWFKIGEPITEPNEHTIRDTDDVRELIDVQIRDVLRGRP